MSRLADLIAQLCPDGVEYKSIGSFAQCVAGATPNSKDPSLWDGNIPWMSSGEVNKRIIRSTDRCITQRGFDSCSTKMIPAGAVVVALAGQGRTRGTVARTRIELCTNQSLCAIISDSNVDSDFLFHYLVSQYNNLRAVSSGDGTRGGLNLKMIREYRVPVPPLEVQREIVRILDQFTTLEAELETELEARQAQYEHYRNHLLSMTALKQRCGEIAMRKLGEVGVFHGGLTGKTKADFVDSPDASAFVTYKEIYSRIEIDSIPVGRVQVADKEKQLALQYGDVLFTGSSENSEEVGMTAVVTSEFSERVYLNSFSICFRWSEELFDPGYAKHMFNSPEIRREIQRCASGVTRFNLSKKRMEKISVPVPPLEVQHEIMRVLDDFDALVNDISSGLPAEIAARRAQYDYYRDRLLSFPEKAVSRSDAS